MAGWNIAELDLIDRWPAEVTADKEITYKFPATLPSNYGAPAPGTFYDEFAPFTPAQRQVVRDLFTYLGSVLGFTFREETAADTHADINLFICKGLDPNPKNFAADTRHPGAVDASGVSRCTPPED
jgi:hypothetical protein